MMHTPGPWRVHSTASEALAIYSGFRRVASVPHTDREWTAEDESNAKLIAAAPELLEALKLSLLLVEMSSSYRSVDIAEKARAAINKAFDNG